MDDLVSIGLPTYNGEKSIRRSLDALLEQSYRNIELIISDNCSTDKTETICREYAIKDARVKYIRQEENIGPTNNFRQAHENATGKYFMWATDDDFWHPDFIKEGISTLSQNPESICAVPGFEGVNRQGEVIYQFERREYFPDSKEKYQRAKQYIGLYPIKWKVMAFYGLWRNVEELNRVYVGEFYWGKDTNDMFYMLLAGPFSHMDGIYLQKEHIPDEIGSKLHRKFRTFTKKYPGLYEILRSVRVAYSVMTSRYFPKYIEYIVKDIDFSRIEKVQLIAWVIFSTNHLFRGKM